MPVKVRRTTVASVSIELSSSEALVLLEELANVRGGARLPKLRQVCQKLEALFVLVKNGGAKEEAPTIRRSLEQRQEKPSL